MNTPTTTALPDEIAEGTRRESPSDWFDDPLVYIRPAHDYIALDERARSWWRRANWGAAWELTCVRSGLDPHALDWERLCRGRHLDPEALYSLTAPGNCELFDPRSPRKMSLGRALLQVHTAIQQRQLMTLPSYAFERPLHRHMLLLRRVAVRDFCRWVEGVGWAQTAPWPSEEGNSAPAPVEKDTEVLQLPVRTKFQRLVKLVQAHFQAAYEQGGFETPTTLDVERYLVEVLREPSNHKQAAEIAKLLRPDNVPEGPRERLPRSR